MKARIAPNTIVVMFMMIEARNALIPGIRRLSRIASSKSRIAKLRRSIGNPSKYTNIARMKSIEKPLQQIPTITNTSSIMMYRKRSMY